MCVARSKIDQVAGAKSGELAVRGGRVLEFLAVRRDRDVAFFRAAQQCLAASTSEPSRTVVSHAHYFWRYRPRAE